MIMVTLINLIILAICAWLFFRQEFLLSPTSIFVAYVCLTLPGSYIISNALDIKSVFYDSPADVKNEFIVFGLFATALGIFALMLGRVTASILPRMKRASVALIRQRFLFMLPAAVTLALMCAIYLSSALGGLDRIISELGAIRSGELVGKGLQVYAVTMLLPTVCQWYLVFCLKSNGESRYLALIMCILSSLLGAGFGFRAPAVALIIQVLVIWYLLKKGPSKKTMIVGVALFVPMVTLAGVARFLTNDIVVNVLSEADLKLITTYLLDTTLTRVRGFEAFSILMPYVDATHYGFFLENLSETVLSIVPSLFVTKSISLTENIATQVFGRYLFDAGVIKEIYGGVSYTFISEGYWNAGFFGVFVYGFFFGLIFKIVERAEDYKSPSNMQILFYKAFAGFAPLLVEAPQLGVNAIVVNIFVNVCILVILSCPVTRSHQR